MGASVEVMPIEVMVPIEAVVPVEPVMLARPAWMTARDTVTAPGTVTAHRPRLTGRDRQHDGQCGERHEEQRARTYQLVHVHASLSLSHPLRRLPEHAGFTGDR